MPRCGCHRQKKTPITVGVFNGNPFAANVGRPFMADIKKYPGMHPICACGLHDYGCRNAVATGKRKRRQPSAFLMTIPLQQGQVFNAEKAHLRRLYQVAIPLQQGQVFNTSTRSSLTRRRVAIPLKQGQVFNKCSQSLKLYRKSRNPFEAGTSF